MVRRRIYNSIALFLSLLLVTASACVSKGAYEELQRQQAQTQQRLSAQQAELSRLDSALSLEQANATAQRSQVSVLREQLSAADTKASSLETELAKTQRTVSNLESQLSSLTRELSTAQSKASALETQVSSLQSSLEKETQESSRLNAELAQAKNASTALAQQIDSLKGELYQERSTSVSLNRQADDLKSQITFLQSLVAAKPPTTAEVFAKVRPAIVRIKSSGGEGSGFFFDKEGRILTNAHVVGADKSVTVVVDDARSYTGSVVGRDEVMDVAVVKLSLARDTYLVLADSEKAAVGDEVLAVGYPLGSMLGGQATLTKGVVSARRQDQTAQWLQIDASINPGNSGGPLLNSRGEVIGVNTAKVGGAEAIGFALAINSVKGILPTLLEGKVISSPWSIYQNADWRYSIGFPTTWTVDETEKRNIKARSSEGIAIVQVMSYQATGVTLEQWTNQTIAFRRSEAISFQELSRSRILLPGNISAYSVLYLKTMAGQTEPRRYRSILALVGNRYFEVLAFVRESKWSEHGTQLEQIALSFAPQP